MPLNRDQQAKSEKTKSVVDYTSGRHHQRTAGLDLVDTDRPATPQNAGNKRPRSQTRRENVNSNGPAVNGGKRFSLDSDLDSDFGTFNGFKVTVPNTMAAAQHKTPRPAAPFQGRSQSRPQKPLAGGRVEKEAPQISAFDDTTSIGPSMLEDSTLDDNVTAVHKPKAEPARQHESQIPYHDDDRDDVLGGNYSTQDVMDQFGLGQDWEQELAEERMYQAEKAGYVPTPSRDAHSFDYSLSKSRVAGRMPARAVEQPETPSRVRSVPPDHGKVHAPVPKRTVGFVSSPQVMGDVIDSPQFRSEELAREDSPAKSISRPNSARPVSHSMPIHPRPQQITSNPHVRRQSTQPNPPQANRFQNMQDHRSRMMQQEQKVSAPESDVQDSSDDERAARARLENPDTASKHVENIPPTGKKRPLGDVEALDYDADTLSKKTLGELQREPHTQDPRAPDKTPAIDSNGNEMKLPQILENLSRMAPEQQQATFSTLTDEEWAETGQWFVDKFQTDLKKLVEVRLRRRQIALRFEDKIRRRQRQVEYQQAGIEKQLKELQEGGTGLLKDRPAAGGSRSGTPLRTPRG